MSIISAMLKTKLRNGIQCHRYIQSLTHPNATLSIKLLNHHDMMRVKMILLICQRTYILMIHSRHIIDTRITSAMLIAIL